MSCCNNLKGNCGNDCPVRRANSFPLATGASLKAPPKPLPPVEPSPRTSKAGHLARWLVITTACGFALVAVAGFFKH